MGRLGKESESREVNEMWERFEEIYCKANNRRELGRDLEEVITRVIEKGERMKLQHWHRQER